MAMTPRISQLQCSMIVLIVLLINSCNSSPVSGFTIVEPLAGATYHPGDKVTLKAMTGPNEHPVLVYLHSREMQYADLYSAAPYILTFSIPSEFTGNDTLVATAKFADGTIIEKEVKIQVVLPANIVLQGISVDPKRILLQKLPEGSDPNKVRAYESRRLGVGGIYSDGVQRYVASSEDGTTYASSDEKVVTVDKEGNVAAQGIGTATITVKNGKHTATVKVVVKPYKK